MNTNAGGTGSIDGTETHVDRHCKKDDGREAESVARTSVSAATPGSMMLRAPPYIADTSP